eukprot:scaffold313046_cov37-Tisochrysis_lutea.AAC.1
MEMKERPNTCTGIQEAGEPEEDMRRTDDEDKRRREPVRTRDKQGITNDIIEGYTAPERNFRGTLGKHGAGAGHDELKAKARAGRQCPVRNLHVKAPSNEHVAGDGRPGDKEREADQGWGTKRRAARGQGTLPVAARQSKQKIPEESGGSGRRF